MKVLILGGTGAMGIYLVQLLNNNGIETVVTSRHAKSAEGKIRYIQGNAHDLEFLQKILQEHWDVIVDFMVYSTTSFKERVDLFLQATSQYIFLSSARVYANSAQPITEISPILLNVTQDKEFLSTTDYSLTKARQEDILKNSKYKNWTIIRPYITYSKNRLQLGNLEKEEWLYRALHGRTIVFSNDIISKITTMTYGLDVSKGIMAIIGNSKILGETFHITIENSNTWEDILDIYLEILENNLGYRPKVLLLDLNIFLECHPTKYSIIYDRLYNRRFDNSKIGRHVNTNRFIQTEEGLKNCLAEFLKNPQFKGIDWKTEAFRDRQTKEHTSLDEISGLKQKIKYLLFRYFTKNKLGI
jgi:nucleoside-diphosphate-sugar epimerase